MGFLKALIRSKKKTTKRKSPKKKVKKKTSSKKVKKKTIKKSKKVKKKPKKKKTTKKKVTKKMKKTKPRKKAVKKKPAKRKVKKKPVRKPKKRILKKKKTVKKRKPVKKKKKVRKKTTKKKPKKKSKKKKTKKRKTKKKKKPQKPKVELLEERLPKKRALKLITEPEVEEFIIDVAGDEGYRTYKFLVKVGKEIDEYSLADKVDLQINFVRSLLYKLYDHKLVSFFRERDKKKGWFIYSWTAHPAKLKYILIRGKEKKIRKYELEMLKQHDSFHCENCNKNFEYSKAIENMFFCDLCGSQLDVIKATEIKKRIEKQIEILKEKIAELKKI